MPSLPDDSLQPVHFTSLRTIPNAATGSAPITILHPVHSLAVGGLERQLAAIVTALTPQDCRHVIAVRESVAPSSRVAIPDHVKIVDLSKHGAHLSRQLAQIIDDENIDIVHVRGFTLLVDSVVAARVMRSVPVVSSFHGFEDRTNIWSGVRKKMIREALNNCQDRWAVSNAAADEVCRRLNLPADLFTIIPNGVDADRFVPVGDRTAVRKALDIPPRSFVFLSVGNLKLIKGHDYLLRAFARLENRRDYPVPKLIIVGADHLNGELQHLAQKLNIADRVHFMGAVANPLRWYQAADVFVLPSLAEGHCNALLEALACGLPAIATRTGGNIDTIRDRENGMLVAPADAAELATAMRAVIGDEELRRRLSTCARESVVDRFSRATMIDKYLSGYRNVLNCARQAESIRPAVLNRETAAI